MQTETLPDFSQCVKALAGAFAQSAKALQIEISVAFVVFHQFGETSIDARRALRQVYADAGRRDCLTPDSPAYQTVMRRIGRCAALFDTFGKRKVGKAIGGRAGAAAIQMVFQMLEPLEIETMDDVSAHAGKPRKPAETAPPAKMAPARRAIDAPDVFHVKTRHIDVAVPPDTPAKELITLANRLLALAEKMGK